MSVWDHYGYKTMTKLTNSKRFFFWFFKFQIKINKTPVPSQSILMTDRVHPSSNGVKIKYQTNLKGQYILRKSTLNLSKGFGFKRKF